jgi:hypothetical protein
MLYEAELEPLQVNAAVTGVKHHHRDMPLVDSSGDRRVLSTDILFDVGRSLNPAVDLGQIEGAFTIGMGLCVSGACVACLGWQKGSSCTLSARTCCSSAWGRVALSPTCMHACLRRAHGARPGVWRSHHHKHMELQAAGRVRRACAPQCLAPQGQRVAEQTKYCGCVGLCMKGDAHVAMCDGKSCTQRGTCCLGDDLTGGWEEAEVNNNRQLVGAGPLGSPAGARASFLCSLFFLTRIIVPTQHWAVLMVAQGPIDKVTGSAGTGRPCEA